MTTILLLLTGVIGFVATAVPIFDGKIVNGHPASIDNYPYQVSLQYNSGHICGGTVIGSKYVVTACHCTDGLTASELSIRAGSTYHNSGGQVIKISKIMQHPQYDSETLDYDISVLKLARDLKMKKRRGISRIELPRSNEALSPGKQAVCTGWGALTEGGNSPANLMYVFLRIMSLKDCQNDYKPANLTVTPRMVCTFQPSKDACQGDSGGPLVVDKKLVGIVSWGVGCASAKYPGVYSDVGVLRSFIKTKTGL